MSLYIGVINLGTHNYTIKSYCGNASKAVPHSSQQTPSFCGVTEELSKRFIKTQSEIVAEFAKDPKSMGIAGTLPPYWMAKLEGKNVQEKDEIIHKTFMLFRAAMKHLKPYNAQKNNPHYNQGKAELENKRIKEVSQFLTKGLRKFGILADTNSVKLKKLKVKGSYTDRAYVLSEKGEHPTLEKLFIKKFKKQNHLSQMNDSHGQYAELAHGLYANNEIKNSVIQRFYWGDTSQGYMTTEYLVPPKHVSPIVKLKKVYSDAAEFAADFYRQTGLKLKDLHQYSVPYGKTLENKEFIPLDKASIINKYIASVLEKANLRHSDLHEQNAIIGSTRDGQPVLKLIDIGGLSQI